MPELWSLASNGSIALDIQTLIAGIRVSGPDEECLPQGLENILLQDLSSPRLGSYSRRQPYRFLFPSTFLWLPLARSPASVSISHPTFPSSRPAALFGCIFFGPLETVRAFEGVMGLDRSISPYGPLHSHSMTYHISFGKKGRDRR
jgi:hypothetical protein